MSSQSNQVPDAWDQDWAAAVDTQGPDSSAEPVPEKKLSSRAAKAQRRAEHVEFNRQLWAEAETPQTFHFLESRADVPIKSEYKAPMKVLARKPQSNRSGLEFGVHGLSVNDHEQDDDDDSEKKPGQLTYEERVAKAQKEREEKQRKYEEVRERLFGSSNPGSGASSPGNVTPPRQGQQQQGSNEVKRKGRNNRSNTAGNREGKGAKERDGNLSASSKPSGRLYDPSYSPKANSSYVQRKEREQGSGGIQNPQSQQQGLPQSPPQSSQPQMPIRSPRGPDPSGRGGFGGFPSRGARGS